VRRAFAALLVLVASSGVAGCGGSSSSGQKGPLYAGMTRSAAKDGALAQSGSQTSDASDDLYGHHLRLLGVTEGHDPAGNPAWQVAFRDLSDYRKPRYCIWFADGQYSGAVTLVDCPKQA
jgi:predicted small lipoprotein YifL